MNNKTLGIITGIVLTLIVMAVSVCMTIFYIYIYQPGFLCEICQCPDILDIIRIK